MAKKKKSKNWIEFDFTVHYTIEGRKRYKRKLWGVVGLLVLVLLACSAMFYFGNTTWDPEKGFEPVATPNTWWQILLVVLASVISFGAMVATFLYCFFDINKFYKSQAVYFKTNRFKENKAKALDRDMLKIDKKTLKWYKKMGYIDAQEKRDILERQRQAQLAKIKTAK